MHSDSAIQQKALFIVLQVRHDFVAGYGDWY
jgi:hypothetical protein